jgi:catechol 2,3-dioxygenase-like lactoylglutathione lyase family enzyme
VTNTIATMLTHYEQGKLSRRQFIQALAVLAAIPQAAPAADSTFQGVGLNHIALRVTDLSRSRDFYSCFLRVGRKFLALFRGQNSRMDHYCFEIENFNASQVVEKLKQAGLSPRRSGNRVYFPDPDGLTVQLSSVEHGP